MNAKALNVPIAPKLSSFVLYPQRGAKIRGLKMADVATAMELRRTELAETDRRSAEEWAVSLRVRGHRALRIKGRKT